MGAETAGFFKSDTWQSATVSTSPSPSLSPRQDKPAQVSRCARRKTKNICPPLPCIPSIALKLSTQVLILLSIFLALWDTNYYYYQPFPFSMRFRWHFCINTNGITSCGPGGKGRFRPQSAQQTHILHQCSMQAGRAGRQADM